MRRNARTRGFSLTELLAATAMVTIALVGTVAAMASAASLAETTAHSRAAQRVAEGILEQVRSTPFDQIVATFHGTSHVLPYVAIDTSAAVADTVVRRIDDATTTWAVYEVTVLVRWTDGGGSTSIRFATYVSDRVWGSELSSPAVLEPQL